MKTSVRLLPAAVALLLAAGCATGNQPAPNAGSDSAGITFSFWGTNSEAASLRAIAAAFEQANPGTKVTTNWIQSDYEQKIQTSIAGGTQSTVIQISNTSLAGFAPSFAEQQVDPAQFVQPNISSSMQFEGKYYATPFAAKPKVMAINVDAFKAAGVPLPSATTPLTLDEFRALAAKLSHGEGKARVYGSSNLWYRGWLTAAGGGYFNAGATECTFGDATGVKTAQYVVDLQNEKSAPTALDIQGQDQAQWFAAGRLATFSDFGPWTVADFAKISKPNWTLVPVPGKGFPMEVNGLAISRTASGKQLETAKKFVEFAGTDQTAQDQLIQGNTALGVPVIAASAPTLEKVLPADRNLAAFTAALKSGEVGVSVAREAQLSGDAEKGMNSYTALGSGKDDVAKILPELAATCTQALKK
ncbi:extracellular solute-binding protein [Kribbella sandramycini]|uniref:Extracellular solute-binding protein n=1 Tax=Kribbella sandramycini TaxID=60450 RepID=A0A7Y4KUR6_9ACTN|nr:extracellular solute-binding protein [Kribbella sandramycini]MBB6568508.1 multiple sugar transport system substrate-binding protein [Kribbella sandramycini]NOL38904.1 extracellular solute-binding protein [Kribbella sandramycini]